MTAWAFILLSSGCSVLVAHLLKYTEHQKLDTLRVLTVNYGMAACVAFVSAGGPFRYTGVDPLAPVLLLAAIVGVLFITNFFIYSKSVNHNGVGISVAAMRISLLIPVLLSTYWYHEYLLVRQWVGVSFVFVTLYLLLPEKKSLLTRPYNASWLLVLLFLFTGLGDASLKIFEADFSGNLAKEQFMGIVFLVAFTAGLASIAIKKEWNFTRKEIVTGFAIGVPNLYSAIFLIEALSLLSGAVVYTAANLFTVIGATFLGIWFWGDMLSRFQWIGLGCTIISIWLLV